MAQLRCPRCRTLVTVTPGVNPVCPSCGFTGSVPASVPEAAATAATPYAQPAPASPIYSTPGTGFSPAAGTAATQAPVQFGRAWGKPRNFWISFLLGIVTFGVYYYVWNFKVFKELDQEHGEKHAASWFWIALASQIIGLAIFFVMYLSIIGSAVASGKSELDPAASVGALVVLIVLSATSTALFLAYAYKEIVRVERYRQARGLKEGLQPVWFLLLYILGGVVLYIPMIVAYFLLQKSINEVWWSVYAQRQMPWPL